MINILRYNENFSYLSAYSPENGSSGKLNFCAGDYISDIAEKLLGITAPKPTPENLLTTDFYFSNGYYYYTLPDNDTDDLTFGEVLDFIPFGDNHIYAVFTTYQYQETFAQTLQYNGIEFICRGDDYQIIKVERNIPLADISSQFDNSYNTFFENVKKYFPLLVILTAIVLICIVIRVFFF